MEWYEQNVEVGRPKMFREDRSELKLKKYIYIYHVKYYKLKNKKEHNRKLHNKQVPVYIVFLRSLKSLLKSHGLR